MLHKLSLTELGGQSCATFVRNAVLCRYFSCFSVGLTSFCLAPLSFAPICQHCCRRYMFSLQVIAFFLSQSYERKISSDTL